MEGMTADQTRNGIRAIRAWFPKGRMAVGVLGSSTFYDPFSPSICSYLGEALWTSGATLCTTNSHGIAEMVTWSYNYFGGKEAKKRAFHFVPHSSKAPGDVVEKTYNGFVVAGGSTEKERDKLFSMLTPVYILIEGGPGSASIVRSAVQQGAIVIPVGRTGGAACGLFGAPYCPKPSCVSARDWMALGDPWDDAESTVTCITRILQVLHRSFYSP